MTVSIVGHEDGRLDVVRSLPCRFWSYQDLAWLVPDTQTHADPLLQGLYGTGLFHDLSADETLPTIVSSLMDRFEQALESRH
jgi:hypothetical protein